jgi:hypothetical protein
MSSIPASLSGKTHRVLGFRVPVAILNPTQNVLAAVDFDLKFTYVLAGWKVQHMMLPSLLMH